MDRDYLKYVWGEFLGFCEKLKIPSKEQPDFAVLVDFSAVWKDERTLKIRFVRMGTEEVPTLEELSTVQNYAVFTGSNSSSVSYDIVDDGGGSMSISLKRRYFHGELIKFVAGKLPWYKRDVTAMFLIDKPAGVSIEGFDITLDIHTSFRILELGGKLQIPMPSKSIGLIVPAGHDCKKLLRIKGQGFPKDAESRGDLFVRLNV